MDLESRVRWEDYFRAKEEMLALTSTLEAAWHIVAAHDKKRARLNCIDHFLSIPSYEEVPHEEIALPERAYHEDYERRDLPPGMFVPRAY